MVLAARYPISVALLLGAVLAATGMFVFTRPQYRPHDATSIAAPDYVVGPTHGWAWPRTVPGFRFGTDESSWNASELRWADLAAARYGARAAGVDPQALRVLDAARLEDGARPYVLVAGRGCIGMQLERSTRFFCGAALQDNVAVMLAAARPGRSIYIDGVVSADVARVTVTTAGATPAGPQVVWRKGWRTWGTFTSYRSQPVAWNARVDFYGASGLLATRELRFSHPGERVYAVAADRFS